MTLDCVLLTESEPGGFLLNYQKAPRVGLEPRSGWRPTGAARTGRTPIRPSGANGGL